MKQNVEKILNKFKLRYLISIFILKDYFNRYFKLF